MQFEKAYLLYPCPARVLELRLYYVLQEIPDTMTFLILCNQHGDLVRSLNNIRSSLLKRPTHVQLSFLQAMTFHEKNALGLSAKAEWAVVKCRFKREGCIASLLRIL